MTLAELQERLAGGEVVLPVNEVAPWALLHVSRASFYRAVAAGQVPGVLTLGRRRLLQLQVFLRWVGADAGARS